MQLRRSLLAATGYQCAREEAMSECLHPLPYWDRFMMLKIATICAAVSLTAITVPSSQSDPQFVRFHAEARVADPNAIRLPFPAEQRDVSLMSPPLIDLASVSRAFVVPDGFRPGFRVAVEFTAAGQASMLRATASVVGQRLVVVVNDTIKLMPIIKTPLEGPVPITDALIEDQATQLAATINGKLTALRK